LTTAQKVHIEFLLEEMQQYCLSEALYDYMVNNDKTFKFIADPNNPARGGYDPQTNNMVFKDPLTLQYGAFQEELFHAYQNFTMSGGTTEYAGAPGSANIEFEAKILLNIFMYIEFNGGGAKPAIPNSPDFDNWLDDITDGWTKYPTSFSTGQLYNYFYFLDKFPNRSDYSYTQVKPNMMPTAMFNLINSADC